MTLLNLVIVLLISAGVGALFMSAWRITEALHRRLDAIHQFLSDPTDRTLRLSLVRDEDLEARWTGVRAMTGSQLEHDLARRRARTQSERARLTTQVELMPMLGLLGTVLGIILTFLRTGTGDVGGLWLALITTLVGLSGAVLAKYWLETRADEAYQLILQLLDDPRVAKAIEVGLAVDAGAAEVPAAAILGEGA